MKMKFRDAPLGTRFNYANIVWVKIGSNLIAEWRGNVEGFQKICSFYDESEDVDSDTEIELI